MEASIFSQFLDQIWSKLQLFITEKTNGNKRELTYLHKQRLVKVYSPTQQWEGTSANTKAVAADMVALDSPLPIKRRGSVSKANGKLPKVGMTKKMNESDINAVNIMNAELTMMPEGSDRFIQRRRQIFSKLLDDVNACSVGIDERNEMNYLIGLSEGVVLIPDEENPNSGLGLRINYGYKDSNVFGVNDPDEITGDDIQNVIDKADENGDTPALAMISKSFFDRLRKTRWARQLAADYKELVYTNDTALPVPTVKTFSEAWENEYGMPIQVIDRSVVIEKNGQDKSFKPFNPNRIVFLPNADTDGSLVYGTLAESTHPVNGVIYSTVDEYKLISKYRITDPSLAEITKGQALVLPVIEDVDSIYILDGSKNVPLDKSDSDEAGEVDEKITINGQAYQKSAVIEALQALGVDVKETYKDSTVIKKINALSDEDTATFMEAIKDSTYGG